VKNKGLGKGLRALIPPSSGGFVGEEILEIPVDKIQPGATQARQEFDQQSLRELAESIRRHGVIQPVLVRPIENGRYELIVGERRWRASQIAGLKTIPAVVKKVDLMTSSEMMLVENLQRKDLNPVEEAAAYKRLLDEFGLTQEEISRRVGKSRPYVTNMLRLLQLPEEVLQLLAKGVITTGHGKVLLGVTDPQLQVALAREVAEKQLSVRHLEKRVRTVLQEKRGHSKGSVEEKRKEKDERYAGLEKRLTEVLGARVKVKPGKRGGRIEIICSKDSEFERIIGHLAKLFHG